MHDTLSSYQQHDSINIVASVPFQVLPESHTISFNI